MFLPLSVRYSRSLAFSIMPARVASVPNPAVSFSFALRVDQLRFCQCYTLPKVTYPLYKI